MIAKYKEQERASERYRRRAEPKPAGRALFADPDPEPDVLWPDLAGIAASSWADGEPDVSAPLAICTPNPKESR